MSDDLWNGLERIAKQSDPDDLMTPTQKALSETREKGEKVLKGIKDDENKWAQGVKHDITWTLDSDNPQAFLKRETASRYDDDFYDSDDEEDIPGVAFLNPNHPDAQAYQDAWEATGTEVPPKDISKMKHFVPTGKHNLTTGFSYSHDSNCDKCVATKARDKTRQSSRQFCASCIEYGHTASMHEAGSDCKCGHPKTGHGMGGCHSCECPSTWKIASIQKDAIGNSQIPVNPFSKKHLDGFDASDIYEKIGPIKAEQVKEDTDFSTILDSGHEEAKERANAGDYIITNPGGERYKNTEKNFLKTYEPHPTDPGVFNVRSDAPKARVTQIGTSPESGDWHTMQPWGGESPDEPGKQIDVKQPMHGGDYLMTKVDSDGKSTATPDDIWSRPYGIGKKEFEQTYRKRQGSIKAANKYIKQRGDKWVVIQKGSGKVLSHHDSEQKAEASFSAMMANKYGQAVAPPVTVDGPGPAMNITHGEAGSANTVEPVPHVLFNPVCGHSTSNPICEHCSKR